MIKRVTKEVADNYIIAGRRLEYKNMDIFMIGGNRFYITKDATPEELWLFRSEWHASGLAELPSFKFNEERRDQ